MSATAPRALTFGNASLILGDERQDFSLAGTAAHEDPSFRNGNLATFARQDRELRHWEDPVTLDTVETAIDAARDDLRAAAGEQVHQVAVALARGEEPDTAALEETIAGQLLALYGTGRQSVADELARQGAPQATFAFADGDGSPDELLARARAAVEGIVARIAALVKRLIVGGRRSEADVQAAAEREGQAALKAEAVAHASGALNLGRSDEADARASEIRGSRYTSILDPGRCSRCAAADDDTLRPLGDPVRLRRRPPNPDCEGGDRCRCIEVFELRQEAPAGFSQEGRARPNGPAAGGQTFGWEERRHPRDSHGRFRGRALGAAPVEVDAGEFHAAFQKARRGPRGPFLTPYTAADFTRMRCFLAHDGKVGGAIKNGNELVSLFNAGGPPGAARVVLRHLVSQGASRLDCLGPGLRRIYEDEGFETVSATRWDDQHAPEGWDYEKWRRPNVYVMALRR